MNKKKGILIKLAFMKEKPVCKTYLGALCQFSVVAVGPADEVHYMYLMNGQTTLVILIKLTMLAVTCLRLQ